MRKYRNYTHEDIKKYSKEVKSIAGLLRKLGLRPVGGNYVNIKRLIQKLNVDTSHWTGQGWNKSQQLKDWSEYTRANNCKKHLIREKGHVCDECGLENWLGEQIPLEIHHIDGERTNNSLNNLRLLCNNCHAQTENWRRSKLAIDTERSSV